MEYSNNEEEFDKLVEKSYPPETKRHIIIPNISIYEAFSMSAEKYRDNIAIDFIGTKISYGDLKNEIERTSAFLNNTGIHQDERLTLMLPNLPQYVVFFMAAAKLGITVVQMNPLYTTPEIEYELKDSGSRNIVIMASSLKKVMPLKTVLLDNVIIVGVDDYLSPGKALLFKLVDKENNIKIQQESGIIRYKHGIPGTTAGNAKIDPSSSVALLQYTGGTTGIPKAATLTHRNLLANANQLIEWFPEDFKEEISYLASIPYFHVYGMMTAMLTPLLQGSELIIIPDPRNQKMILKTIRKKKPTAFPGIPTMYHGIINYPRVEKYGIDNIKLCISGAMSLPQEIQKKFEDITGGTLVEGYGLSECSPVTNISPLQSEYKSKRRQGSIGLPLPDTYEKIVDVNDGVTELPPGKEGELLIKGPQVMVGYWNRPEENKSTLIEGWLHTGDIARMDNDGYFYIVDRKKDLIIAGGYNIYPREVEEVLYENPKISDCAVIGIPHAHRGETVKAFIVPLDKSLTEEEVKKYCREKLSVYKIPKIIEFWDSLPLTLVGKIDKKALREEKR